MLQIRTAGIADRGMSLFVTSIVMVALAALFVSARLAFRLYIRRAGWDDWTILASLILSIVLTLTMSMAIENGYGQHKSALTTVQLRTALQWYYFAQVVYKPIIGLTKTSIVLTYLRVFTTSKTFRIICWTNIAVVALWTLATTIATIFQSVPIAASWNKTIKAKAINSDVFWLAYGGINIATDVIILLLPVQPVLKLQMRLREKVGLLLAFMVGGFVVLTSILRVIAVKASTANKADITWAFVPRATWTLVEANIGIVCACLPALRKPLLLLWSGTGISTAGYTFESQEEQSLARSQAIDSVIRLETQKQDRGHRQDPITVTKEYQVDEQWGFPQREDHKSYF